MAYYADTFACRVSVTRGGQVIYHLSHQAENQQKEPVIVKEHFTGSDIIVSGLGKPVTKACDYSGNDPSKCYSGLPCYQRIGMGHIEPGIRLELKAHGNNVEKLFYIKPGADPGKIRMAIEKAKALRVNAAGELVLLNDSESMRFSKPVAFQYINGQKREVPVEYFVQDQTYGFKIGAYDMTAELAIDPLITGQHRSCSRRRQ